MEIAAMQPVRRKDIFIAMNWSGNVKREIVYLVIVEMQSKKFWMRTIFFYF